MNASEHFDWAVGRAVEYLDMDKAGDAMASLVSDLGNHEGTHNILSADLLYLMTGEILIDGARGLRRFVEGLPRPVGAA